MRRMGRSRSPQRRRWRRLKPERPKRIKFPEYDRKKEDVVKSPRRFSAGDASIGEVAASHLNRTSSRSLRGPEGSGDGGRTVPSGYHGPPWHQRKEKKGNDATNDNENKENNQSPRASPEPRGGILATDPEKKSPPHGDMYGGGVSSPGSSTSLGRQRRRRASWSSTRDAQRSVGFSKYGPVISEDEGSSRASKVPVPLRLRWELMGVSGRDYQKDGNLSLYRKKNLAARRRLFKHKGVREAIERGWWPYLPLQWVVLNEKEIFKILPRQAYKELFVAMYENLVPTAGEAEAMEAANWEYGEDVKRLPLDLRRAGITRGAFSAALFAVADNWTETVLARDYIEFLDLLWRRVRPDLLFPPPSKSEGEKRPPMFSTNVAKEYDGQHDKRGTKSRRTKGNDRRDDDSSIKDRKQMLAERILENGVGARGVGVGGGTRMLGGYHSTRPPPPPPVPAPSTVEGLVLLDIPGFRPKEAQLAPWVLKGGLVDPAVARAIRLGAAPQSARETGMDRGGETQSGMQNRHQQEQQEEQQQEQQRQQQQQEEERQQQIEEGKESTWEDETRKCLLASGIEEEGGDSFGGRKDAGETSKQEDEGEEMDSILDFVARRFPRDRREEDAFALFVERKLAHFLDCEKGKGEEAATLGQSTSMRSVIFAVGAESTTPSTGARPPVVRRYCSEEEYSTRRRRKNVPTKVLESLLEVWNGREEGMTPAEYGAAFIGPLERASFLAYAIRNGWGTTSGGVHSTQALDAVAEEWRLGLGGCVEGDVLWDVLDDVLREEVDDAVDDKFREAVDLYSIPHRLLHDPPHVQRHGQRARTAGSSRSQQHVGQRCVSTAPAGSTSGALGAGLEKARTERFDRGAVVQNNRCGSGGGDGGGRVNRGVEISGEPGLAGRVLLPGEKVAGSIRQGQVAYYKTPCPTEKGACLEVFLACEGLRVGGGRQDSNSATPTGLSLYAVQAPHRPPRLSSYPWTSRGKTSHNLFLHWKGSLSPSAKGRDTRGASSYPRTGACLPWEAGHTPPDHLSGSMAPIHIALVCPEPEPPPGVAAPAFDSDGIENTGEEGLTEKAGREAQCGHSRGPAVEGSVQGAVRIRRTVKFTVGVRFVGPPRVVLEGRWYSLPLGRGTGLGTNKKHPMVVYATVRLPTPLKVTRWGNDPGRDGLIEGERLPEALEVGKCGRVVVTIQVRPYDPKECVDVYCGLSPRPGPNPADHTWWMVAGGGGGKSSKGLQTPPHPVTCDNVESEDDAGRGTGLDRSPCEATDGAALPSGLSRHGTGEELKGGGQRENTVGPAPVDGSAEVGGIGWKRMTVALPRDHNGAFHGAPIMRRGQHLVSLLIPCAVSIVLPLIFMRFNGEVGVFSREPRSLSVGAAPQGGTISLKAAVWCPAVTMPPRIPVCGYLPRGQRRELLWTIERDNLIFEARVEVTRAIEDPLILRQLKFAQDFHRRFCGKADGDDRVVVSEAGRDCQAVHTRPFLLASRWSSPPKSDPTWRGENAEGTIEVLRTDDGAEQVFTRYMETLKVGPRDERYGVGRYRLSIQAGVTDCFFRMLFWNRAATAEDGALLPAHASPRTIPAIQSMGISPAGTIEKLPKKTPAKSDDDSSPPEARPHSSRMHEPEHPPESLALTSRSAPATPDPGPIPRKRTGREECLDGFARPVTAGPLVSIDAEAPRSPRSGVASPTTRSVGDTAARPDSCMATVPSSICVFADGVAASCVSPRSNASGCARQLAMSTQYLNHSFVPTPPQQPTCSRNGSSSSSGRTRPATAVAEAEAVQAGRVSLPGPRCNRSDSSSRTTSVGPRNNSPSRKNSVGQRERGRLSPQPDSRGVWRLDVPAATGDGRVRDVSGLSSRPLVSSRAVSGATTSPSRRKGTPMQRSLSKPMAYSPPSGVVGGGKRSLASSESAFDLEDPAKPRATPSPRKLCNTTPRRPKARPPAPVVGRGNYGSGAELIGEVGYTISSAAVTATASQEKDACDGARAGCHRPEGTSQAIPELALPTSPSGVSGKDRHTPSAAVPQLQLNLLRSQNTS